MLFATLVVAAVLLPVLYVTWTAGRDRGGPGPGPGPGSTAVAGATPTVGPSAPASDGPAPADGSKLLFQHVARDADYARLAWASLDDPGGQRTITGLTCERVHAAGGQGLCLVPEGGLVTRYWAVLFGADFTERTRIELGGSPSRARVSADGRYGATTVFQFGHSYADAAFSTQTTIIDMAAGTVVEELEQFTAYRDGTAIHAPDFNYWGVTFAADSNVFYATLRTAGQTYLVKGDIAAREVRVLRDNVECPSLSPDGTRMAFKKLVGGPGAWRFSVLALATMEETQLAEPESIDDQLEWLDDEHVLYGKAGGLWTVPSDGSGAPELVAADALSPAVVRGP
jgi:hypothetical protein